MIGTPGTQVAYTAADSKYSALSRHRNNADSALRVAGEGRLSIALDTRADRLVRRIRWSVGSGL
jgi:hypothetical protein